MKRILALDIGTERVGVAMSDATRTIASPYGVWNASRKNLTRQLREFPAELGLIIVGLPLNLDGTDSPQTRNIRELVAKLKKRIAVPIELFDERLTTKTAAAVLIAGDVSRPARKQVIDQQAAVVILQHYLEHIRNAEQ